jgi:hypothetical protein
VHSVVSDRLTDHTSFCSILMRLSEPSGRQSGDLGEKRPLEFCLRTLLVLFMPEGSFTCRKSTTWDRRLYFPPKEVVLRIFIALENPSPSVGIEPANLGSSGCTVHFTDLQYTADVVLYINVLSYICNILYTDLEGREQEWRLEGMDSKVKCSN